MKKTCVNRIVGSFLTPFDPICSAKSRLNRFSFLRVYQLCSAYREIDLIDKHIIGCLSVAGSKKTPLCYSKVRGWHMGWNFTDTNMPLYQTCPLAKILWTMPGEELTFCVSMCALANLLRESPFCDVSKNSALPFFAVYLCQISGSSIGINQSLAIPILALLSQYACCLMGFFPVRMVGNMYEFLTARM